MKTLKQKVTVKRKLKELTDVDVNFVSLVDRGANRIPFRILKRDESEAVMTVHIGKKAPVAPQLVAVVVNKGARERVTQVLKDAGLSVDSVGETGNSVIFEQAPYFDEDNCIGVQLSPDVMGVVKGAAVNVKKAFSQWNSSTEFDMNVATQGFMPGIYAATDALMNTISAILSASAEQSEAAGKIKTALADFTAHVNDLVGGLPVEAFKIEKAEHDAAQQVEKTKSAAPKIINVLDPVKFTEAMKAADEATVKAIVETVTARKWVDPKVTSGEADGDTKAKPAVEADPAPAKIDPAAPAAKEGEAAAKTEAPAATAEGATATPAGAGTETPPAGDPAPVAGEGAGDLTNLQKMMLSIAEGQKAFQESLSKSFEGLTKSVSEMKVVTEKLEGRIDTVEKVAKSATEAVAGTVAGGGMSKEDGQVPLQKRAAKSIWAGTMPGLPGD